MYANITFLMYACVYVEILHTLIRQPCLKQLSCISRVLPLLKLLQMGGMLQNNYRIIKVLFIELISPFLPVGVQCCCLKMDNSLEKTCGM